MARRLRCYVFIAAFLLAPVGCESNRASTAEQQAAEAYKQLLLDLELADRIEVTFVDESVRVGPIVITDSETVEATKREMERLVDLAQNHIRFKDTLSGIGARLVFIRRYRQKESSGATEILPYRRTSVRIVGKEFVAIGDSEQFAGMLPDDKLFNELAEVAKQHGLTHPEDVIPVE